MAQYLINYLDGETETVEADGVEYDIDARDYTLHGPDGRGVIALVPAGNVRSIVRQDDGAVTD